MTISAYISVYGIEMGLECHDQSPIDQFIHDFQYFIVTAKTEIPRFTIRVLPTSERPSGWWRVFRHQNTEIFLSRFKERRVRFFDDVWVCYSFADNYCNIFSEDPCKTYEAIYLVTLSFLGESLDREGYHRLHGMGFRLNSLGAVLLAPSGGGKSTIAMELVKSENFQFLSDDTPIIGKNASMLAFPQRIALKEKPDIDHQYIRQFKRFHHREKYVVGADYFGNKVTPTSQIDWLILISSEKQKNSAIREISKYRALFPLCKWLILGYETPQIWQLYVRFSLKDLVIKTGILFHRIHITYGLLKKVRVATFQIAEDSETSSNTLKTFFSFQANGV